VPKETRDILLLVEAALDEFDAVPLSTSVRKAIRIANLLGDSKTAVRLNLEVKPTAGDRVANGEDIKRFLESPDNWEDPDGPAERAVTEYMADRAYEGDTVLAHSLAELEFWDAERPDRTQMTGTQYERDLKFQQKRVQVVEVARSRVFALLCGWERQLTFAATNEHTLTSYQLRVDELLDRSAPDVLQRFNAVFRRLAEVSESTTETETAEVLAQAVTTCRRILKAVVDAVQPADPDTRATPEGHALTDDAYKNRLFEFIKKVVGSESFSAALKAATESLHERFAAVDKLSSKGVHATVAQSEAEFCALNTYLLAGEIVRLHAVPDADRSAMKDS
jgi:hypothetical protein